MNPYDAGLRDAEDRQLAQSARIREFNDALRTSPDLLGVLLARGAFVITSGIAARGNAFVDRALAAARAFNDFNENNNPYGEHDFGSFTLDDTDIFWKIDYYDNEMRCLSPIPADPSMTKRVLTILLADKY